MFSQSPSRSAEFARERIVVNHIKFCLEEIEAEIDALDGAILTARDRASLGLHIAGLRLILDGIAETRRDAATPIVPVPVSVNAVASAEIAACDSSEKARDDLSLIRGVTAADLQMLDGNGITSFAAIASWRRQDIENLGGGKPLFQRICREVWIEQAAVLAEGKLTAHALAIADDETARTSAKLEPLASAGTEPPLAAIATPAAPAPQILEPTPKHAPILAKRLEASRRGVPYRQVAATLFFFVMAGAGIAWLTQMQDVMGGPALAMLGELAITGGR